jgi:hypothetical protein
MVSERRDVLFISLLVSAALLILGIFMYLVWSACRVAISLPILRSQGYLLYFVLLCFILILTALFTHIGLSYYRAVKPS